MRVSPELLQRARGLRRDGRQLAQQAHVERLFRQATPPPGVLPEGQKPTLAFDSATTKWAQDASIEASPWAAGAVIGSSFVEGIGWLGYAYLSELAQRPEYRAAVETIAQEMTREWIELKSISSEEDRTKELKELDAALTKLRVKEHFTKACEHDGFFGRGHLYLDTGDTDDPNELKQSIGNGRSERSRGKVSPEKPLKRLVNVEPVWTYPTRYNSIDPLKPDWYRPSEWFVMGKEVHETRLLTFIGREVPDMLKPSYSFGGLSMSQMGKPYVDNWLRTRQSVADIIQAFSVMVLGTDLSALLQEGGDALFSRLELFNLLRSNAAVMAINKETEEFQNVSAPLGSLDALQAQTQEHMAAVWKIPLVKLLGIQPAGLNASSEGEIRTFYDTIAAFQELLFRQNLDRVLAFAQLSLWGEVDPHIGYEFKPLWQLDEAGLAAVQKTRADTHDAYIAMGAVSAEEVRKTIASDPESPYAGLNMDPEAVPEPPQPDDLGEGEPGNGPSDPKNQMASAVTTKAAEFGGAASGGFAARDGFELNTAAE